jgi:glucokinase
MNLDNQPQSCAIGLDVGGTKIAAGIVSFPAGNVLAKQIIPTKPERGGKAVLADAVQLAETLISRAKAKAWNIVGIGVGVCELVDLTGNITSSHTVAWAGLPVQATFSKLAPTIIEADVRAPALAEATFGAGQSFKIFVYVTVGTGISYCLVLDKQPYSGAQGNALIFASSPLTTTCTECGTVLHPILEEFAAGPPLVKRYNQRTKQQASHQAVNRAEAVLAAATNGDTIAAEVITSAGEALGVSVGWLVNVLDPEAVIVGGGLGSTAGLYWDSFVASTRSHIWSDTSRALPILPALLGPDAGFIGAATTVFQDQRKN